MPYVYKVTHKISGKYYIGVRYSKLSHPDDLFVTYFTSSNTIKRMIKNEGASAFETEVLKVFDSAEAAISYEYDLIKENIEDIKCLNMNVGSNHVYKSESRKIFLPDGKTSYQIGAEKAAQTMKTAGIYSLSYRKALEKNPDLPKIRAAKAKATRSKVGEDGLTSYQRHAVFADRNGASMQATKNKISESVKKFYVDNPEAGLENYKKSIQTRLEVGSDGLNSYERVGRMNSRNSSVNGSIWINDGKSNIRLKKGFTIPEGYVIGRIKFRHKTEKVSVECPHCGKRGKRGRNMTVYHFDNCKEMP